MDGSNGLTQMGVGGVLLMGEASAWPVSGHNGQPNWNGSVQLFKCIHKDLVWVLSWCSEHEGGGGGRGHVSEQEALSGHGVALSGHGVADS